MEQNESIKVFLGKNKEKAMEVAKDLLEACKKHNVKYVSFCFNIGGDDYGVIGADAKTFYDAVMSHMKLTVISNEATRQTTVKRAQRWY